MRKSLIVIFAVVAGALLLSGCSTSTIMTNPELAKADYSQRTLAIYPTHSHDIVVKNPDDVRDDYADRRGAPEEIIASLLYSNGYNAVDDFYKKIQLQKIARRDFYSPSMYPDKFFSVDLEVHDDSGVLTMKKFYAPTAEAMRSAGLTADVVLYFNHFETTKEFGKGPGSQGYLAGYVDFIIWDYEQEKPVSWGSHRVVSSYMIACSELTWNNLIGLAMKESFKNTNFLDNTRWQPIN